VSAPVHFVALLKFRSGRLVLQSTTSEAKPLFVLAVWAAGLNRGAVGGGEKGRGIKGAGGANRYVGL